MDLNSEDPDAPPSNPPQPSWNFKIIGCGREGTEILHQLQSDYKDDFTEIKMVTFNRKIKQDFLVRGGQVPQSDELAEEQLEGSEDKEQLDEETPRDLEGGASTGKGLSLRARFSQFSMSLRNLFKTKQEPEALEDEDVQVEAPQAPVEESQEPKELDAPAASLSSEPLETRSESELDYSEEQRALISDCSEELEDIDIAFLICSLEGEGDIDNAEIIANTANELEVFNIVIVELPSTFNKIDDVHIANRVLQKLRLIADIVVAVPEIAKIGLWYLVQSIQELKSLITTPGLVNLDLADLKIIVKGGNVALIGFGESSGEERIPKALDITLKSPLLNVDLEAVEKALVNVTGGENMTLEEAERVSNAVRKAIKPKSRIIFGATVDCAAQDKVKVMLVVGATPMQVLINAYAQS